MAEEVKNNGDAPEGNAEDKESHNSKGLMKNQMNLLKKQNERISALLKKIQVQSDEIGKCGEQITYHKAELIRMSFNCCLLIDIKSDYKSQLALLDSSHVALELRYNDLLSNSKKALALKEEQIGNLATELSRIELTNDSQRELEEQSDMFEEQKQKLELEKESLRDEVSRLKVDLDLLVEEARQHSDRIRECEKDKQKLLERIATDQEGITKTHTEELKNSMEETEGLRLQVEELKEHCRKLELEKDVQTAEIRQEMAQIEEKYRKTRASLGDYNEIQKEKQRLEEELQKMRRSPDQEIISIASRQAEKGLEVVRLRTKINELTSLLEDSESTCGLLNDQMITLKGEMRTSGVTDEERDAVKQISYLKSVVMNFLVSKERDRMVPALLNVFNFTAEERANILSKYKIETTEKESSYFFGSGGWF